jgi:siroheme decarboxylase
MQMVADPAMRLADRWQRDFPLVPRPFAQIGAEDGVTENEVIDMIDGLVVDGRLGRIGATVRPNVMGASTLAAISVPRDRLDEVAAVVSAEACVNHNYERENAINLWFVVTAPDKASLAAILGRIRTRTGLEILDLPLERAYHIDLGFSLSGGPKPTSCHAVAAPCPEPDDADRALVAAIEDGLPLVPRPYAIVAETLGISEADVIARIGRLGEAGIITRFGCILRHRALGFRANAMAVWDVPDEVVNDLAQELAIRPEVTLCYRRTRRRPAWPYNLFCMIHGRERGAVAALVQHAARTTGLAQFPSATLFSTRCFKQRGARFSARQFEGAA